MSHELSEPMDAAIRAEVIKPGRSYIVQAPAGSGKTELLTQRFLQLLALVERPQKVLAVTFTRKATQEMLERILERLHDAESENAPLEPHKLCAHELALKVLEQDRKLGWGLLQNPGQLQIHTIDGLCARIAARGNGVPLALGGLAVIDHPGPHYAEAARQTIDTAANEAGDSLAREALEELLFRERGNANRVQDMLASELSRRDQWLEEMVAGGQSRDRLLAMRQQLELEVLKHALGEADLERACAAVVELAGLADDAPGVDDLLAAYSRYSEAVADPGSEPGAALTAETECTWRVLRYLGSAKCEPYAPRSINKNFLPGASPARDSYLAEIKEIVGTWGSSMDAVKAFKRFCQYPPLDLGIDNERQLQAFRCLLVNACAQLNLQFASHGVCDFQHIAQQALKALGDDQEPGEALLIEDGRLEHILIDEFQDTSQLQYALVERLVEGWQAGDQRSLFLVGDPMQSIYAFRKADVTLFDRVVEQGHLGSVALSYRQLEVNFRSRQEVIDSVNRNCEQLFVPPSPASPGFVAYTPVAPFNGSGGEVTVNAVLKAGDGSGERTEAEAIARHIRGLLEQHERETEGRNSKTPFSVGVLTRKRKQLEPVARALQAQQLSFEAVEVESLKTRPVILDLLTITRALLHPGDRIAWLGLLMAPWCALQPTELAQVAGPKNGADLVSRCQDDGILGALDATTAKKVRKTGEALEAAQRAAMSASLPERVEACWVRLGGPRIARRPEDLDDADVFLELLAKVVADEPENLVDSLNERLERLYSGSRNASIQLMTIHKAKGLEFDAVFLPGLQTASGGNNSSLFRYREFSSGHGSGGSLLALTKPSGNRLPSLFDYLGLLAGEAESCEAQRLLYVAMTRARRYLALSAVVEFKKDGGLARVGGTFLGMLEEPFSPAIDGLEKTQSNALPDEVDCSVPIWCLASAVPEIEASRARDELVTLGEPAPDRGRLALGEALHHWLELIHDHWSARWLDDWFEEYRQALQASLSLAGAPRHQVAELHDELVSLLRRLLETPEMVEQLSPQGKSRSFAEAQYLVPDRGRLRQLIIDRLYQDESGLWHVVDYKTGLDQSVTREKWARQLSSYANAVQQAEKGEIAEAVVLQAGSAKLIDPAA